MELNSLNLDSVKGFGYESLVRGKFFEIRYSKGDVIDDLENRLCKLAGIHRDNKIAFIIRNMDNQPLAIGFYDWTCSIGTRVVKDNISHF